MSTSRDELEQKIADAEARVLALRSGDGIFNGNDELDNTPSFAEKIEEAGSVTVDFVKRHPFAVIGGAIAVGAIVSLLIPNSPTRRAGKVVGGQAKKQASAFNALASQFALSFGAHLLDMLQEARETGKEKLEDASDAAHHAGETARHAAADAKTKFGRLVRH